MKNAVNIFHNTTTFVFPIVIGGDHLAEVGVGAVDELGVEKGIRFGVDGIEVEFAIREKETLCEFAGAKAGEHLVEVFFQCRGILDGELKLGETERAVDAKFEDLVELMGLLGRGGFIVGIWIVDLLMMMLW